MINYQQFKENYITKRNTHFDFSVLTDMATENDDPSILLIPVLKKLKSLKHYIWAIFSKFNSHVNSLFAPGSENKEYQRQYTVNRIIKVQSPTESNEEISRLFRSMYWLLLITEERLESSMKKNQNTNYTIIDPVFQILTPIYLIHHTIDDINSFINLNKKNVENLGEKLFDDKEFGNIMHVLNFFESLSHYLKILAAHFEKSSPEIFVKHNL